MAFGQDADGPKEFKQMCAGCHGDGAKGTDRGPSLANSRRLRNRSEAQLLTVIRDGTQGGMPGFPMAEPQLRGLARWVRSLNQSAFDSKPEGGARAGERFFAGAGKCAECHMVRGVGGSNGPDLSDIGRQMTLPELQRTLDAPATSAAKRSAPGCPGWASCPQNPWAVVTLRMKNGVALRGFARNRGPHDLVLQTFDGQFHPLLEGEYQSVQAEAGSYMPALKATPEQRRDLVAYLSGLDGVKEGALAANAAAPRAGTPASGDWPTYNGALHGNRHSALNQINAANVSQLRHAWSYSIPYFALEMTPLVAEGTMIVSGPNQVCALNARTGREIWCYTRPRTPAGHIAGDAAKGANRGTAMLGDRVFFATDNAHLLCINRITGALMWEVQVPEDPERTGSTAAPLVVGDLVITGIAGGDNGMRGFIAAYKVTTGQLAWRFWTVPKRGEPGSETWSGKAIDVGGAATWLTGSYDAGTGLLYWPTGNPFPDTDGTDRQGINLYTNCVVALDVKTGALKWYFQFTPHDLHDWDATEPLVLVDAKFQGRDRKLLLQANRNGFYYALDRVTGEYLLGAPFVKKLTWAKGIAKDGSPILNDGNRPTPLGVKSCPQVRGATNWYSTAFHPATRLFYVMAVEDCSIYRQSALGGYEPYNDPADPPTKYLRALDFETGKVAWEIPQFGPPESNYSGVLSTAGGLVFFGETGGGFAAADAKAGRVLWHFETNDIWKASPMTYMVNGKQFVSIAAGGNVHAFALP